MRTLIYARFSSQLQNPRSCADQIAECRARADKEGWTVVDTFSDHAIGGAAGIEQAQRPGLHGLLARAETGGIDQVLTESTDRIARHGGDAFAVRERLEYAGVRLFTLMDGAVDELTGTIKGLFDARFRKDLGQRVKRGHRGAIAQGRAATGIAFGYCRVLRFDEKGEAIRGLREVDPDQAAVVLRIFAEYHAGRSPIQIAAALNAEGVPGPKGHVWERSAIRGSGEGFGILRNPIYIGQLHYGRSRAVTDPRTRRRRMKPGDGPVAIGDAPALRIVPDELWQVVQDQIESRRLTSPQAQRRPRHILSGLIVCGICGSKYVKARTHHWQCSRYTRTRTCTNSRMIHQRDLEGRVIADLKGQMLAPDAVAAYLRTYHREHARQSAALTRDRTALDRRLAEAERKLARMVDVIATGGGEFAELRAALATARDDRDRARSELASLTALPVLALHPGLADRYREEIEELERSLADPAATLEAVPRFRALIDRVVVQPNPEKQRGVLLHVVRRIDEILNLATTPRRAAS